DQGAKVTEVDIQLAGLAVAKRAYRIFQERRYEAVILPAAMRGNHHVQELAGARMTLSIHPSVQVPLLAANPPRELRIDRPVPEDSIARLNTIPDFRRAYEPDGLQPAEFITYGLTQRTLAQFVEAGWKLIEAN